MFDGLKTKIAEKFADNWIEGRVRDMKMPQKTTIVGILTIAATIIGQGISVLQGGHVDWRVLTAGVGAGWGLIHAADQNPK